MSESIDLSVVPFAPERLSSIFRVDPASPDRVLSRESGWLEFKQAFNWASNAEYARTLAAFANSRGGYIVFGVTNHPRTLCGINANALESLDPTKVSAFLNDAFSSEIRWEMHVHRMQGAAFGLLFVAEADEKPVICTKNVGGDLREGDIYFRYRGRSTRIRYAELKRILDEQRRREQAIWLKHLGQIARVGVSNAAILDTASGKVSGAKGTYVIDESLLPSMQFIREGEFREVAGTPAVRIVGDARVLATGLIRPTREVLRPQAIHTEEIVHAFLENRNVAEPRKYIEQACFEMTGYLPVFHFIRQSGMSIAEARQIIETTKTTSPARRKLLKRLTTEDLGLPLPTTNSDSTRKRRDCYDRLLRRATIADLPVSDLVYLLQAMRILKAEQIERDYLCTLLKSLFDEFYSDRASDLQTDLRCAICYVDNVLNRSFCDRRTNPKGGT